MKIQTILEARYAGKGPESGWAAKKVIDTFFAIDNEWTEELHGDYPEPDQQLHNAVAYVVKDELVVVENGRAGNQVHYVYGLNNGKYLMQNENTETEWLTDPSKFTVRQTRELYTG